MAGVEGEVAQPVKDRFSPIDLDRQGVVRSMTDHDIGAGVDRRMRDLGHVLQHLLAQPPMARCDQDINTRAQRRDVLREGGLRFSNGEVMDASRRRPSGKNLDSVYDPVYSRRISPAQQAMQPVDLSTERPDVSSEKARRFVDDEIARWTPVIKAIGLKLE